MPRVCCWILLVWLWLIANPIAWSGIITTAKSGSAQALVIAFTPDPTGVTSSSELEISVSAAAGAAATRDRNLEIVLYISSQFGKSLAYPVQVTLPQGALTASAKVQYVQATGYGQWVVDVFEDGRKISSPASFPGSFNSQQRLTWLEITPSGLKAPPTVQMDFSLPPNSVSTLGLSDASEDWRTYLSFDAVIIPESQIKVASAAQIQAFSTYALAGGNLIVHSTGDEATLLMDRLLNNLPDQVSLDDRWESIQSGQRDYGFKRTHGGGHLFAIERAPPTITDLVSKSVHFPLSSFTINGDTDFRWFWKNLVRSVGTAPVWGFIAFVTLFVLVVGPFLLRFTTRIRHRTLLLFLVPTLSLGATLLVLIYNVAREGFGTVGRVAAVQYHDDRTGNGFTWSRQSYFSGAPPREGLRFPRGSILKPIDSEFQNTNYIYDPRDKVAGVVGEDQESCVLSKWLLPRNQQQLLVGQRSDNCTLPISITRLSDTSIKIHSRIDHSIPLLVLKQSMEVAYLIEDLQPGQSLEAVAQSAAKIDSLIRSEARDYEPQEPDAIDVASFRYYGYYNRVANHDPIDNVIQKLDCSQLDDFGFWILLLQPPEIPLPFDRSIYVPEKHFLIMTGVSKW